MSQIHVAVLRGGPSSEYDISLKTGNAVLKELWSDPEKYRAEDIVIDKKGDWHRNGEKKDPHNAIKNFSVVFNALHGEYGEDGKVQKILEAHNIPFTGSESFASALAMNKAKTKEAILTHGIKTPYFKILRKSKDPINELIETFRSFPHPVVIKPVSEGSSIGVYIANDFHSFSDSILHLFNYYDRVLIEEYIKGREATCGVIDSFRERDYYTLMPVEIIPDNHFFDYQSKYSGKSSEICPANFDSATNQKLQELSEKIHKILKLRHYSRSDFIVHPRRGIYFLEVNTLPGLTEASLFPKALLAAGCSLKHFIDHVISSAIGERG